MRFFLSRSKSSEIANSSPGTSQSPERTIQRRQFRRLRSKSRRTIDDDDELSEVHPNAVPSEVREWLASTFSKKTTAQRKDQRTS
ncbi:hypothetical protein CEXT_787831 [Caerostris extrusa]|uniref:PDE1 N-terminal domain-containing protein n=1 Tax=Caerostris extrusa TaxID=172846 RepID=A0AAV4PB71_CAEEX|nr:hypothetical protein CEXT_787831 [Caerostris extrusa]